MITGYVDGASHVQSTPVKELVLGLGFKAALCQLPLACLVVQAPAAKILAGMGGHFKLRLLL